MSPRERVAVVTPRPECRRSAESWAPLLSDRAELACVPSPESALVDEADLVLVDEECPGLDRWIADAASGEHGTRAIVVFGTRGASERGALSWGEEGTEVLATLSDLLDHRKLLQESDEFLEGLRASTDRVDEERRRFAKLVLDQADAQRGVNVELTREVEELTRLQALARFFAAPGPEESFADRMAEGVARARGAQGAGSARREAGETSLWGSWRISRRNALGMLGPDGGWPASPGRRESTRKGTDGWWIPLTGPGAGGDRIALILLLRRGEAPATGLGPRFLGDARALLEEGLAARWKSEAVRSRQTQSERIVQTLRGGLLRIDGAGRVRFANPACEAILGRRPSDLEGRRLEDVFPLDANLCGQLAAAARGQSVPEEHETSVLDPDGRRISLSVRISPLPEGGGAEGVLVLLSDLSRRKKVEEEIRRADRLAALGRLSAGVAHEVRNPLTGIRTTAELLQGRVGDDANLRPFVDVILEEAIRLDRIVGSLLQFAKPSEPRLLPLPVPEILERGRQLAAGRAVERGVGIEVSWADDLPLALADRDQMLQVLLNLLLNAVEAAPEGGTVRLEAGPEAIRGRKHLAITVRDEGQGVPSHLRERIFDPFFTTKPGGTGLGLSISQNILRQHEGALRIESTAGQGTRATALLPAVGPDDVSPAPGGDPWRTS